MDSLRRFTSSMLDSSSLHLGLQMSSTNLLPQKFASTPESVIEATEVADRLLLVGSSVFGPTDKKANKVNVNDLASYLEHYHKGHYLLFNLNAIEADLEHDNVPTNEPKGMDQFWTTVKFDTRPSSVKIASKLHEQLLDFSWDRDGIKSHTPPLELMFQICYALFSWLSFDPDNVAIIQCTTGKTRSGVLVACYLLFIHLEDDPMQAFASFYRQRWEMDALTTDGLSSKTPPSLQRFLHHFHALIENPGIRNDQPMVFKALIMRGLPVELQPCIQMWDDHRMIFSSEDHPFTHDSREHRPVIEWDTEEGFLAIMWETGVHICGGFSILCSFGDEYEDADDIDTASKVLFRYVDSTWFHRAGLFTLEKKDLDMMKQYEHAFDEETFSVDLVLHNDDKASADSDVQVNLTGNAAVRQGIIEIAKHHTVLPDPLLYASITKMGYHPSTVTFALQKTNNRLDAALELLESPGVQVCFPKQTPAEASLEEVDSGRGWKSFTTNPLKELMPKQTTAEVVALQSAKRHSQPTSIDICSVCEEDDYLTRSQLITCKGDCHKNFHTGCVGLPKIPFGFMTMNDRTNHDAYIQKYFGNWQCDMCGIVDVPMDLSPPTNTHSGKLRELGTFLRNSDLSIDDLLNIAAMSNLPPPPLSSDSVSASVVASHDSRSSDYTDDTWNEDTMKDQVKDTPIPDEVGQEDASIIPESDTEAPDVQAVSSEQEDVSSSLKFKVHVADPRAAMLSQLLAAREPSHDAQVSEASSVQETADIEEKQASTPNVEVKAPAPDARANMLNQLLAARKSSPVVDTSKNEEDQVSAHTPESEPSTAEPKAGMLSQLLAARKPSPGPETPPVGESTATSSQDQPQRFDNKEEGAKEEPTDARSAMLSQLLAKRNKVATKPVAPKKQDTSDRSSTPSQVIEERQEPAEATSEKKPTSDAGNGRLKDDLVFGKYFKMLKMGLPEGAVKHKMTLDGLNDSVLDLGPDALASDATSVKAKVEVKPNRRKKLHWQPISQERLSNLRSQTIWEDDNEADTEFELDVDELESLFFANAQPPSSSKRQNSEKVARPKSVTLIDGKKAMNLAITLATIKMAHHEIADSIRSFDASRLTLEQISAINGYLPTSEEVKKVNEYTGDVTILGEAEKFIVEIAQVPRYASRTECLLFTLSFPSQKNDIGTSASHVVDACEQVKSSKRLKKLLSMVLKLGNRLNGGGDGEEDSIRGFKVDSLLRLGQTKAVNKRTTVLHYLVRLAHKNHPPVLDFALDLPSVPLAARENFKNIKDTIKMLYTGFEKLQNELSHLQKDGEEAAISRLNTKIESIGKEIRILEASIQSAETEVFGVFDYFGEDPTRDPTEFFATLASFCTTFEKAKREVDASDAAARRAERGRLRRAVSVANAAEFDKARSMTRRRSMSECE